MNNVDRYMNAIAVRKVSPKKGQYSLNTLLALHICHLPRHQELVRVLYKYMELIAMADPTDDAELMAELINHALTALGKVDEIACDGLVLMGAEVATNNDGEDDAN